MFAAVMENDSQNMKQLTADAIKSGKKDINLTFDMDNIEVSGNQGTYVFGLKQPATAPAASAPAPAPVTKPAADDVGCGVV